MTIEELIISDDCSPPYVVHTIMDELSEYDNKSLVEFLRCAWSVIVFRMMEQDKADYHDIYLFAAYHRRVLGFMLQSIDPVE